MQRIFEYNLKIKMKKILSTLLFSYCTILCTSCNKSVEKEPWTATISANKIQSLPELFSTNQNENLIEIVSTKDIAKMSEYNKIKANQIASYFIDKYKIDIRAEFKENPEGIIILGMLYASKEYENKKLNTRGTSLAAFKEPEAMNCFLTAVSDVIGISQAKALWASIVAGATEETVIAAVSLIGRRVAGVITITLMVYSTGECLGWW
jgi:hypothetical protein